MLAYLALAAAMVAGANPLEPGDHKRALTCGGIRRSYIVHVPPGVNRSKPAPVVLALHGAAMDGSMMAWFSGLNRKADEAGFIAVYPSGTGFGPLKAWNSGGLSGPLAAGKPDDVAFISSLLDDLETVAKVDTKRVYACGLSNGGMMCYRLASELSGRIAAIAPVAGTVTVEPSKPSRPVPVIHFHGTGDTIVPFEIKRGKGPPFVKLKGVRESVGLWVEINGCHDAKPAETLAQPPEDLPVIRETWTGGKNGSEVVLVTIKDGGHTWPGEKPPVGFIGKSTRKVSANDLIWEFFQRHPMK